MERLSELFITFKEWMAPQIEPDRGNSLCFVLFVQNKSKSCPVLPAPMRCKNLSQVVACSFITEKSCNGKWWWHHQMCRIHSLSQRSRMCLHLSGLDVVRGFFWVSISHSFILSWQLESRFSLSGLDRNCLIRCQYQLSAEAASLLPAVIWAWTAQELECLLNCFFCYTRGKSNNGEPASI